MKSVASNLADLKPNLEWASLPLFDRKEWKRVRFGDVVENCAETCDPQEAGVERFIAMEHLEPGSLHIRSWGNVADGTTFTRRCRPGQVLFGKRRAYQRKVAVAEFEAVVSGDIYVLKPKNESLLTELLPFLCLSERFFEHAVGTSAGSLSPRTNWSSLASFEFDLPPLDQQRRIAEILWAVDEVITSRENFEKATVKACRAFLNRTIDAGRHAASTRKHEWPYWHEVALSEVVEFLDGKRKPIKEADRAKRNGIFPYYGASGIIDTIDDFIFDEPLVLLGEDGANILERSSPLAFRVSGKIWVNNHAHVLRVKPPNSLIYIEYYLESLDFKPFVTGSAQPKLNKSVCEEIRIPIPDKSFQTEIESHLLAFEDSTKALSEHREQERSLLSSLLNQLTCVPL
jgi:restriction endonuclease S subunit